MQRKDLLAITFCIALSTLVGYSSPEVSASTAKPVNGVVTSAVVKKASVTKAKTVAEKSGIKKASGTKYTNATVNVRADASSSSKKLGTLKINVKVTVTGKVNNGWTRISYKGKQAYIKSSYLSDKKTSVKPSDSNSNNNSAKDKSKWPEAETDTRSPEEVAADIMDDFGYVDGDYSNNVSK